jgi:cytochrome c551/c552
VLVCRELEEPRRTVYALECGLDLTTVVMAQPADPTSCLELRSSYTVGCLAGGAVERTTIGPVWRSVEQRFQGRARGEASGSMEQDR